MDKKDIDLDDSLCLNEISNGSYEAFDTLYMRYSPLVEKFVYSLLKRQDEADDITQNIFMKIWTCRNSMSGVSSFRAYLFKMVKNAVYDAFSKRKPTGNLFDEINLDDLVIFQEEGPYLALRFFNQNFSLHLAAPFPSQGIPV